MADRFRQREEETEAAVAGGVVGEVAEVGERGRAGLSQDFGELLGMGGGAAVVLHRDFNVAGGSVGDQRFVGGDGRREVVEIEQAGVAADAGDAERLGAVDPGGVEGDGVGAHGRVGRGEARGSPKAP